MRGEKRKKEKKKRKRLLLLANDAGQGPERGIGLIGLFL
jgi:hypothetical protein